MSQSKRAGNHRVHPAASSLQDLTNHLGVDPDRGLSPKEAADRLERGRRRPLFVRDGLSLTTCLKRAFAEPVLWILLAVCVVALFFNRVVVGLSCMFLAILNGLVCAWAHHYAERVDGAMQTYDVPLCRVLRNGRVVRVPADAVVRGDVIILHPGDVLPADVRLLTAEDVTVTEYALDASASEPERLRLTKCAETIPTDMPRRHSPENMIFAGAIMERGRATALVVDVGLQTHLGAMTGGVKPARTARTPKAYRQARKYISFWNFMLAFVIVPVTAIGIFSLGKRFDLLDLFLTSLALAVVSLTEHLLAQGLFVGTWIRARAAENRDTDNAAAIKTSADLERLGEMTHLMLVGTAGLHDGTLRPDAVSVGGVTYTLPSSEPDRAAQGLSQKLYLWKKALTDQGGVPTGESALFYAIDEINRWVDPDAEALALRVRHLVARWGEVAVTYRDGHRVFLNVTSDFAEVDACQQVATAKGLVPFDGAARYDWYRAYGQAIHNGQQMFFLISETGDVRCAEGMLTLSTHMCRKTIGCIRDLEEAGIAVTAFLRDESAENARVLQACGLVSDQRPAPVIAGTDNSPYASAYEAMRDGVRAFEGCDTGYMRQYIADVQAAGGHVGVLSVEDVDMPLLDMADVAITCAPDVFAESMKGNTPRLMDPLLGEADGLSHSQCAPDLARRRAHVVVRRGSVHGGGVCGVRHALLAATRFKTALNRAVRFVLVSTLLRLVAVLLPVIFGLTLLSASAVLLSGLVVDLLAVACYAFVDQPVSPDRPSVGGTTQGLDRPHITFRWDLVAAAVAAVLPWIAVGVSTLTGYRFGASTEYVGFLSLMGTQLVLFLTGRPSRRSRLTFFVTLCMVCLYVGGLAVGLGAGLRLLWCLVWPLISPAAFLAVYAATRQSTR